MLPSAPVMEVILGKHWLLARIVEKLPILKIQILL